MGTYAPPVSDGFAQPFPGFIDEVPVAVAVIVGPGNVGTAPVGV